MWLANGIAVLQVRVLTVFALLHSLKSPRAVLDARLTRSRTPDIVDACIINVCPASFHQSLPACRTIQLILSVVPTVLLWIP